MKKIMLLILVTGFACNFTAFAQKADDAKIPSAVKGSFAKDFPNINAKWEKEKTTYEANFKQNGKAMSAVYDASGNKIETEMGIKISALPAAVTTYIAQNYKGEKIKEAAIITKANGEINYETEIKGQDILFTKEGKFIAVSKD